ncbi:Na+/H+ antiporter NhaA [Candidatus Comchoanobacter bicostacola]|uniref:Na(+)/H(+) antiporter NhaA n=1 Tax=Candidatus Comchoanobacter bicostacola TaxID=2919598 RepID=A0ABY5DLY6_9GAMM|nr:Na+/H+ antiporter NhaA [Candidatus Comchoanobacter bicostacola]UTC24938.1 Na+/H+ antiporter NhaA [Candidatus Comchoanobacter bicostacola]
MDDNVSVWPGLAVLFSAAVALLVCNVGFDSYYDTFWGSELLNLHNHDISMRFVVNEILMVLFFFYITLEIKYEYLYGVLQSPKERVMPALAALGGMVGPACIYLLVAARVYTHGWAIPVATDIAFSLACLMLVGQRLPVSLRVFLMSLAIFDDLGAIAIIAVYYTAHYSWYLLAGTFASITYLTIISRLRAHVTLYILGGLMLWVLCFLSGVHMTLAGVAIAAFLPMKNDMGLWAMRIHHACGKVVQYFIMPVFAFANAGVALHEVAGSLNSSLALAIALGLLIGKPLGILSVCILSEYLGVAQMPKSMHKRHLLGVSFLCAIGFTMSLFIGNLAFKSMPDAVLDIVRVSVIGASTLAGIIGILILLFCVKVDNNEKRKI